MPVLVDTNVIGDVIYRDPVWAGWANGQLSQYEGALFINPVIYQTYFPGVPLICP